MKDKILSSSTNCVAYIMSQKQGAIHIDFTVDNGKVLYVIDDTGENRRLYNEYKDAVSNNDVLNVDLIKYNRCIRYLKHISADFRRKNGI